ncbi:MAG: hypothetical protein NXI31_26215 [bacterium]|nr:hypothetical protein [bacterium]
MAADVQLLAFAADEFYGIHERWPTHAELLELDDALPRRDMWDQEYTFEMTAAGELRVRSPGMDEVPNTADDIVSWSMRGGQRYAERREWEEPEQVHERNGQPFAGARKRVR